MSDRSAPLGERGALRDIFAAHIASIRTAVADYPEDALLNTSPADLGTYFAQGLIPPVAKVYVATIKAGIAPGVAGKLLLWAIPGALIQLVGGPRRQLGVLLSTGLLILNASAGWAVLVGILLRLLIQRRWGESARNKAEVFAAGCIAGDALYSFFNSMARANLKSR